MQRSTSSSPTRRRTTASTCASCATCRAGCRSATSTISIARRWRVPRCARRRRRFIGRRTFRPSASSTSSEPMRGTIRPRAGDSRRGPSARRATASCASRTQPRTASTLHGKRRHVAARLRESQPLGPLRHRQLRGRLPEPHPLPVRRAARRRHLDIDDITLPIEVDKDAEAGQEVRASYQFEVAVSVRGMQWQITRREVRENSAIFRTYDQLFPGKPGTAGRRTERRARICSRYSSIPARA